MKKLTFLVFHKEYDNFLKDIRNLGVVHVAEKQRGTAAEDSELQENMRLSARLNSVLNQFESLNAAAKRSIENKIGDPDRGIQIVDEVENLQNEKSRLNQQLQSYQKDKTTLQPWGDFSPESIRKLQESGMDISFYVAPEKSYNPEWEENYNSVIISRLASKVYFITLNPKGTEVNLDVELVKLPHYSSSELQRLIDDTEKSLADNQEQLSELAAKEAPSLEAAIKKLHSEIEFSKVLLNTESTVDEKLMLLEGWVPVTKESEVIQFLNSQHVYFEIRNPKPDDNVPIQLNNKGFFAWFEPICRLYMLPKYGELDLTPFFAPFFMVFFGLCLGDIGYGLFLLIVVTGYRLFAKNISNSLKPVLSLVQILAISTMVCGLLTGGFFGYNLYELDWPIVQRLRNLALDNNQMFQLSLILGVIQILFGMVLKVINLTIQFGFKYAVASLGWVILFFSIIIAVIIPSVMPLGGTIHLIVMAIAGLMIFLYNTPDKNIFINIGLGFWDTYNMATGLLGDILSYVRLFALGLSGGILASVFNSLAAGLKPDNVIAGPIVFILIFVFGHAINIFMNVLGAIVHPMRLTFVEFFKNAGYEGGGREYTPFKKNNQVD